MSEPHDFLGALAHIRPDTMAYAQESGFTIVRDADQVRIFHEDCASPLVDAHVDLFFLTWQVVPRIKPTDHPMPPVAIDSRGLEVAVPLCWCDRAGTRPAMRKGDPVRKIMHSDTAPLPPILAALVACLERGGTWWLQADCDPAKPLEINIGAAEPKGPG